MHTIAQLIVRDVAELPDRSSPLDATDMMSVTPDELSKIVMDRMSENMQLTEREIVLLRVACMLWMTKISDEISKMEWPRFREFAIENGEKCNELRDVANKLHVHRKTIGTAISA